MKKNIIPGFAGIIVAFIICINAPGQVSFSNKQSSETSLREPVLRNGLDINPKWYEASYGFVTKVTIDEADYRIDFDKNGKWLYTIRTYNEAKLPSNVAQLVRSSYNDYRITVVQEIEMPASSKIYIIHLDGKTDIINLRVCNNEMDEWEKIYKSNSGGKNSN